MLLGSSYLPISKAILACNGYTLKVEKVKKQKCLNYVDTSRSVLILGQISNARNALNLGCRLNPKHVIISR
jgi:hypothetical protein